MARSTSGFARHATLSRAARLLNDFRFEQSDPARFYGAIADDTAQMVADWHPAPLDGAVILDVGGGPGYFADAFDDRGAHYISVEPDPSEMHAGGLDHRASVRGDGRHLPFADASMDVTVSSNVVEHTSAPWAMAEEMLRVTRPGGTVIISYTLWWGPFGGHEMGLTHYAGGHRAARWYTRRHGHPPKNLFGTSLFPVTAAQGLRWAADAAPRASRVAAFPRYLPHRLWWVMRVPGLREVLGTNLVLVLRKR
ncbi:class I SAM-dependent methyltransferase [Gordonia hankookensis]|uniref:Class I SAM-dependent methyltransferase n=1 Tax=Gordonia hankookensis TaxID=589403 RepID=A0ABR7WAW8_9ACTN|nr:class I SAM-dependent methyltransferase [Gordonia hankookensis]MBD1319941.1 class I SAM-dependent methyltransferase [Gordonia hankookensis]NDZ94499.1 class I SAM-dependent methyltransferase [Streptomyces sp. SID11726]NEB24553.1 class I SAM-dependent methyltransferase [Streptomyces sp. SID6673]